MYDTRTEQQRSRLVWPGGLNWMHVTLVEKVYKLHWKECRHLYPQKGFDSDLFSCTNPRWLAGCGLFHSFVEFGLGFYEQWKQQTSGKWTKAGKPKKPKYKSQRELEIYEMSTTHSDSAIVCIQSLLNYPQQLSSLVTTRTTTTTSLKMQIAEELWQCG